MIDYQFIVPCITFLLGFFIARLFVRTDRAEKRIGEKSAKTRWSDELRT